MKKIWQLMIFLLATLSFVMVAFWWECDDLWYQSRHAKTLYDHCMEDNMSDLWAGGCDYEYANWQEWLTQYNDCLSIETQIERAKISCPTCANNINRDSYTYLNLSECCFNQHFHAPYCNNQNWDDEWQVNSEWNWAQTETSPTPATPDTNWGAQEPTPQNTQCEQTVTCNTWAWEMPDPTNPCKCVCNPDKKCCGVQLNTVVPFIWDCIELDADSSRGDTTSVNSMTAFPILMQWLMKILMSVIMVFSFIMVIVAWLLMTTWAFWKSNGFDKWKTILKNVIISLILLWCSWLILSLINPSFFK